jgi:hypothetical protein
MHSLREEPKKINTLQVANEPIAKVPIIRE